MIFLIYSTNTRITNGQSAKYSARLDPLIMVDQGNDASKKSVLEALKDKQNEEKLKSAFDQYDTDKSGHLSLDEFEKFASDFLKILVSVNNSKQIENIVFKPNYN